MEANSRLTSFEDLLAQLEQGGVLHQNLPGEQTVQIPTERGEIDGSIYIRWQDSDAVIQFIHPIPVEISVGGIQGLESAIARLNHGLAIPGFDLNHDSMILSYRVFLPLYPRGFVGIDEVQAMFRLAVKSASDFLPTIRRIIAGDAAPENAVACAQQDLAAAEEADDAGSGVA